MKKIIVAFLVLSIIVLAGCKSGGGDPKKVLTEFFDALARKDFTAVKKYSTKDSEAMLSMVQMGMANIKDTAQTMEFNKENIEIGDVAMDGDKATIPVKERKSGETTDFTLKKESGDWKVAFDKSTLMEMAQKKMKEHGTNGMNDSLGNMNHANMPQLDSVSKEDMERAQKMMDSANKMLKNAGKNPQ